MCAAKKQAAAPEFRLLPLPAAVWDHHRAALERSMAGWREARKMAPVLLLTGPAGVGKRSVAYFLGQWLLCERTGFRTEEASQDGLFGAGFGAPNSEPASPDKAPLEPCGTCAACQRALSGNWVDFTEISADSEDGESSTGTLKIDQFRKLKETMGFGAYDGSYRITLIRDADRLTAQAANSLLKLLEEPPQGWVFLLTASDSSNLLPTLVSRCQKFRLRPFSTETLEQLLARDPSLSDDKRRACATLAQGSWGKALRLADGDAWEQRLEVLYFLETPEAQLNALVDWASAEPGQLQTLLDQLEQALAELLRWSVDPAGTRLSHKALREHAEATTRRVGGAEAARDFWSRRATRVFAARSESLAPVNKKLLVQDLLLPFCGK